MNRNRCSLLLCHLTFLKSRLSLRALWSVTLSGKHTNASETIRWLSEVRDVTDLVILLPVSALWWNFCAMEPHVDPFLQTLLSISKELNDDDFKNLKFLCEGTIPFGRLEAISRPQELFIELMHSFALNNDNKDYLAVLLYHIGRHDLRNRLLGIEGIVRVRLTIRPKNARK